MINLEADNIVTISISGASSAGKSTLIDRILRIGLPGHAVVEANSQSHFIRYARVKEAFPKKPRETPRQNSIYKTSRGNFIDLSRLISVSPSGPNLIYLYFQLTEKPIMIEGEEEEAAELFNEIVGQWKKYKGER